MTLPTSRLLYLLIFLSSAGLIAGAMFFEHIMELEPCPLCMSQRIAVLALGLVGLIGWIHNPTGKGKRVYGGFILLFALMGAALAIRQLYIQHLPPDAVPACLPSLEYLVEVMPIVELMSVMLSGTGDCAEVQWVFLGLSIPGWTLVCFIGYALLGILELVRKPASSN
ncbi:disulfide bond formation protein B [Parendozoicomonas haliclonae]|uniref:Disulfide bond formation protein B n=1 Tax=Parendozoicomonas haliclonae TaxID=1960125 RepID=A0A1X7AIS5_9GAMM|nr:disulfide bond formation protein B [Parendozoicomonas haliclonae]SMA45660.1 Disulfide bond formation protein B [Parendozoicomonas haliclonae]